MTLNMVSEVRLPYFVRHRGRFGVEVRFVAPVSTMRVPARTEVPLFSIAATPVAATAVRMVGTALPASVALAVPVKKAVAAEATKAVATRRRRRRRWRQQWWCQI